MKTTGYQPAKWRMSLSLSEERNVPCASSDGKTVVNAVLRNRSVHFREIPSSIKLKVSCDDTYMYNYNWSPSLIARRFVGGCLSSGWVRTRLQPSTHLVR